jgi:nitrile hydratase
MSYYERWFTMIVTRLLRTDLVKSEELERGKADPRRPRPVLYPEPASSENPEPPVSPRFRPQQRVRARNLHPGGHTRLPRYTRGKLGVVLRDQGAFPLPDTDVNGERLERAPQHVYLVRFEGSELWGERASVRDAVHVDLWEDYLEPA